MAASSDIPRFSGWPGVRSLSRKTASWLTIGFAAVAVYFLLSGTVQEIAYEVIGVSSVAAAYAGIVRIAGRTRPAWQFFGAGLILQVIGDCVSTFYEVHLGHEAPVPSAADVFYLAGYPLYAIGILLVLKELGAEMTRATVLDAVIVFVAVSTVQWMFVVEPALHMATATSTLVVNELYPSMDVLLFVALVQIVIGPIRRSAPYNLLILSVVLVVLADETIMLSGSYHVGGLIDLCYLSSYVFWGAAALQASSGEAPAHSTAGTPRLTYARMAVLGAALVSVPVSSMVEHYLPGRARHTPAAAIGTALIAVLVLLRLGGLLRAVEAQNVQLRKLDQLKDEFVSSVSHELRTPLTSISGYTELVGDPEVGPLTSDQQNYIAIVSRNTDRLLRVVNDLLFFSGMQDGRLELQREDVNLATLAAEAVEMALPNAEAKGLILKCGCATPAHVVGDASRLAQVIDNLVSNAIKFTPAGGQVIVGTSTEPGLATIEVSDTGMGIPAAEQERLFQRFFRSSNAISGAIPGTGLGLYITKAIAEAHGGRVEVESREGAGTVFRIRLPAGSSSEPPADGGGAGPTGQARLRATPRT
ncbi:MAG TPA: HAMP domain-containing sensor histidine kinase [Gaiellaceae bacterium]|nr:HAMP domain-containing sensor histidine kinase [Gaiellaceae bacterium]